ncbi:MAG: hypothetical protein ABH846_02225 [Patescibacteria group bacterium]
MINIYLLLGYDFLVMDKYKTFKLFTQVGILMVVGLFLSIPSIRLSNASLSSNDSHSMSGHETQSCLEHCLDQVQLINNDTFSTPEPQFSVAAIIDPETNFFQILAESPSAFSVGEKLSYCDRILTTQKRE